MDYKDEEGRPVKWRPKSRPRGNASKKHLEAIELLRTLLPYTNIYEECLLPISNKSLYLDILIPDFMIAIEVDGKQHEEFNVHFHKTRLAFGLSKMNDALKEEWCAINKFTLIRLKETEKHEQWRQLILDAFR